MVQGDSYESIQAQAPLASPRLSTKGYTASLEELACDLYDMVEGLSWLAHMPFESSTAKRIREFHDRLPKHLHRRDCEGCKR
jgi:hypothetical protein